MIQEFAVNSDHFERSSSNLLILTTQRCDESKGLETNRNRPSSKKFMISGRRCIMEFLPENHLIGVGNDIPPKRGLDKKICNLS